MMVMDTHPLIIINLLYKIGAAFRSKYIWKAANNKNNQNN